jgi:hypothetical protein
VLIGDNAVPTSDLYDGYTRSFQLDGTQGVAVTPGDGLQTIGTSAKGMTIAVWFRMLATRGAVNQGHNTLFALSDASGVTIKLVVTAGRPGVRLSKPRLLVLISRRVDAIDTSFVSDYGVSETDAPGGARESKFAAKPNGGAVMFMAQAINTAWQHVTLTFGASGVLSTVFWNGQKQLLNFNAIALPNGLPFGPVRMASIGYDGVETGHEKGTAVPTGTAAVSTWTNLVALQGDISDVQLYDYAVPDVRWRSAFTTSTSPRAAPRRRRRTRQARHRRRQAHRRQGRHQARRRPSRRRRCRRHPARRRRCVALCGARVVSRIARCVSRCVTNAPARHACRHSRRALLLLLLPLLLLLRRRRSRRCLPRHRAATCRLRRARRRRVPGRRSLRRPALRHLARRHRCVRCAMQHLHMCAPS